MMHIFSLPDIGEGLAEGEIANWLVAVGDVVAIDDPIAEVQNDKLLQEILSPHAGQVTKLFVEAGTIVTVGQPLVEFDGDGAGSTAAVAHTSADSTAAETRAFAAGPTMIQGKDPSAAPGTQVLGTTAALGMTKPAQNDIILAMPAVRHFAFTHDIDLAKISGTGRHGHITLADVENYASNSSTNNPPTTEKPSFLSEIKIAPPVELDGDRREPLSPVRLAISRGMSTQHVTVPSVANFDAVEVSALVAHRETAKTAAAKQNIKLTYLAYVAKALALVAQKFPELNASVDGREVIFHQPVNIGIAVATDGGLFVPVVKNVAAKSILEIAAEIADLAEKVRAGSIKSDQTTGSTIAISNLGSSGGGWFTPIIPAANVAVLGLGTIAREPIVDAKGRLAIGQMMKLSLVYDHRLIDGVLGQAALNFLKELLHDPKTLFKEGQEKWS